MIKLARERRGQTRQQLTLPVVCVHSDLHGITTSTGSTFDLCSSGMCFYTHIPYPEGYSLQVQITDLWQSPRDCIVKWCSTKGINFYKVGVAFQ